MQRKVKLIDSLRRNSKKLWAGFLLLYSGLLLTFLILNPPAPLLLTLPFYLLIPGYTIIEVLFPKLHKLEKIIVSIGLSIALLVGIKSFMQTFMIVGLFSETIIILILSVACLIAMLTR